VKQHLIPKSLEPIAHLPAARSSHTCRKIQPPASSVADPGCYPRSRILIFIHPGSQIQKQQQKRGVKKICCHKFLCSHKFHKIANYFSFEVLKKKFLANFKE
jgi:hypothetical protein